MDKILVVDDSAVDSKLAGMYLERSEYEPVFAENGIAALEVIDRDPPEVVLTDLVMPEMNGFELVSRIRVRYPHIPVVLMTGQGADDTAVRALQAGAVSYIPKQFLLQSLGETIRAVLLTKAALAEKRKPWSFLSFSEAHYILGYEPDGRSTLIGHLEEELSKMSFCDDADLIRVGTALTEALANAIEHGNLELDSKLRESGDQDYYQLGDARSKQLPYCDRRVRITNRASPVEVSYVIRDEGKGFDHEDLPDPTDPENLTKLSGRGLLLIRTFMDEVRFNEEGTEITMVKRRGST